MARLEDKETPTVEAAAGFDRYHEMPDWDEGVLASDVRLERGDDDAWSNYVRRAGATA